VDVAIVINPMSGRRGGASRGRARAELAAAVLGETGTAGEIFVTERPGHAFELARAALMRGATRVVAWGGDGTVNEVGRALLFSPCALGIVPAGSGNGLARALGTPWSPAAALRHAIGAAVTRIDAGEIAGHVFLNVAGLGFDAHVAHAFGRRGGARGLQGYVSVVARELFGYSPSTYRVQIEGDATVHRALLLSIANGPQWGNGARIAPGARLDDGLLDIVIADLPSAIAALRYAPRLFTGTIDRAPGVVTRRATSVTITADGPCCLHVDGEPVAFDGREVRASVHPGALRVCAAKRAEVRG
jgi:YegS/Rv2252/BmrU family lipid kinase